MPLNLRKVKELSLSHLYLSEKKRSGWGSVRKGSEDGTFKFGGEVLRLEQIHRDLLEIDLVHPARRWRTSIIGGRTRLGEPNGTEPQQYLQKMMTAREGCDRRSAYTLTGCIAISEAWGGFSDPCCSAKICSSPAARRIRQAERGRAQMQKPKSERPCN